MTRRRILGLWNTHGESKMVQTIGFCGRGGMTQLIRVVNRHVLDGKLWIQSRHATRGTTTQSAHGETLVSRLVRDCHRSGSNSLATQHITAIQPVMAQI